MEEKRQTLSQSKTGQMEEKPSKQQRDEAYSTGAGRKAVEVELCKPTSTNRRAPIGLELETKAQAVFGH